MEIFSKRYKANMGSTMHFMCVFLLVSLVRHSESGRTFKAAVYEHAVVQPEVTITPVTRDQALHNMMINLNMYKTQARNAKKKGVEILVFPENGLYGYKFTRETVYPYLEAIPDPESTKWSPCNDPTKFANTEVLKSLSCMAKDNSLYIVADMGDKQACDSQAEGCSSDGRFQYNTAVAFGPDGTLLAKYHKTNLYKEPQFDKAAPQVKYFDTPFGRFGFLICFDILFKEPALSMIEEYGIKNIVYTTAWMDALPLLSAIGYHSSFARGFGVNLLAANVHIPTARAQGSGLYSPEGMKSYYYNNTASSGSRLIVSNLKVLDDHRSRRDTSPQDDEYLKPLPQYDEDMMLSLDRRTNQNDAFTTYKNYTFVPLTKTNDVTTKHVTRNGVSCRLKYKMASTSDDDLLVLGAFDGLRKGYSYFETCVVLRCKDKNDHNTCGKYTYDSDTTFTSFRMTAQLSKSEYILPQVVMARDGQLKLAKAKQWSFYKKNKNATIKFKTGVLKTPLIEAAIVGRYYDGDP